MPEFLVRIEVNLPADMPPEEVGRLVADERLRGRELVEAGAIRRIWRLPGGLRNVGVWHADDATALHELIVSLPMSRWFDASVETLATHPLEAGDA